MEDGVVVAVTGRREVRKGESETYGGREREREKWRG